MAKFCTLKFFLIFRHLLNMGPKHKPWGTPEADFFRNPSEKLLKYTETKLLTSITIRIISKKLYFII